MHQDLIDEKTKDVLAKFVGQAIGRQGLVIEKLFTMTGGAIQENWKLEYSCSGGGKGALVIRADAATSILGSHDKKGEFEILSLVWKAEIKVPKPIVLCEDLDIIGRSFILMEFLPGTTDFNEILKLGNCEELGFELGAELARVHKIRPDHLIFLHQPETNPVWESIYQYREFFSQRGGDNHIAEWAMRWCLVQFETFPSIPLVLVHGDFRSANYLVTATGLSGLLDWEFSGWGDPYSDLGWFCAKCWRYGREETPAGGIASRESFYKGYSSVSQTPVDYSQVVFWEVMALLRWLVIAIQQGDRNFINGEEDLELGLTGLVRPPEIEMMLLELTSPDSWPHKGEQTMSVRR